MPSPLRPAAWAASVSLVVVLTGACSAGPPEAETSPERSAGSATARASASPTPSSTPSSTSSTSSTPATAPAGPDRVLAISVDGLRPAAIEQLGVAGAPVLHDLLRRGSSTLDARSEVESTRTLPNHTGMLTGRRVERAQGGHGVTFNDDSGATVDEAAGEEVASVFDVVHAAGLRTALVASKSKFALFARSWDDVLDADAVVGSPRAVVAEALDQLAEGPGVVFAHVAAPDEVGHARGFESEAYLGAVRRVDRALAAVTDHLSSSAGRTTAVVLTADHGGDAGGHGDVADEDHFTVPFLVVAPGVRGGTDLATVVGVTPPPGRQASYDGPQPVRNGDVANTITGLLGLGPVPGSEFRTVRRALAR